MSLTKMTLDGARWPPLGQKSFAPQSFTRSVVVALNGGLFHNLIRHKGPELATLVPVYVSGQVWRFNMRVQVKRSGGQSE